MAKMGTAVQSRSIAGTRVEAAGTAQTATNFAFSDPRFHESATQRLRRWVLGTAYALRPNRIALMPRLVLMSLARLFTPAAKRDELPDHPVYYSTRGLVGISDDLSVDALLANYAPRLFPGLSYRRDEMVVPGGARGHRSRAHPCGQKSAPPAPSGQIHDHHGSGLRRGDRGLRGAASRQDPAHLDHAARHARLLRRA